MKITKLSNGKLIVDGEWTTILMPKEGQDYTIDFQGFENTDGFVISNFIIIYGEKERVAIKSLLKT